MLNQIDKYWYGPLARKAGFPRFTRLWAVAKHRRDKSFRRITDVELLDLTGRALLSCVERFDELHPPIKGKPGRRSPQDRFLGFFMRKLVWLLRTYVKWLRKGHKRRGDSTFDGPRGESYESARLPRSKTALYQAIHRAIAKLEDSERALIQLRFWTKASLDEIAGMLAYSNRFQASRSLERILEKLRGILLVETNDLPAMDFDSFGIAA